MISNELAVASAAVLGVVVVLSLVFFAGIHVYSKVPPRQLATTVDRLERTVDRIEALSKIVSDDLAAVAIRATEQRATVTATLDRMETATHVVAENLADSVSRADATEGPDGAAADAALRTGDSAEAIHARQDAQP